MLYNQKNYIIKSLAIENYVVQITACFGVIRNWIDSTVNYNWARLHPFTLKTCNGSEKIKKKSSSVQKQKRPMETTTNTFFHDVTQIIN